MPGANFGTLNTRISKRLIDPSNTAVAAADVAQAIIDAIDFWKNEKFYFNQNTVTLALDIGDPYVLQPGNINTTYPNAPVLPSDFLYEDQQDGFTIVYANQTYKVTKVSGARYDFEFLSNGNGIPYIYTFRNGNYELYWLPQLAYQMKVNYYKDYPALVNPSDTNDFTNFADKLIEYDAMERLLRDLRMDEDRANGFMARKMDEFTMLAGRSAEQQATGTMEVNSLIS